jgi:D-hydroxyproline dehydrogenase subunit beta
MTGPGPMPDVAVIGGGIVGTATAAELAERGLSVRLYESTAIAAAASGRNAGVVWRPTDPVLETLYLESLARYRRLGAELAEIGDASFSMPDAPAGVLSLGRDLDALAAAAAETAGLRPDLGARYVDPAELRDLEPGVAPGLGALALDIGYPAHPAATTRAFAALAAARGVEIRVGDAAALELETTPGSGARSVRGVRVAGRTEAAGAVVVAAGPWTPALLDSSRRWRPIRPSWGVVVEVELADPPRHILDDAGVDEPAIPDLATAEAGGRVGFNLVTAGGRTAVGSTALPEEPDPAAWASRLLERGASFLPALADTRIVGSRCCARPQTDDGRPLVGPVPGIDGLYVAAGHGPWGISTGPASGRHLADIIAGVRDPVPAWVAAAVDPIRAGPVPR